MSQREAALDTPNSNSHKTRRLDRSRSLYIDYEPTVGKATSRRIRRQVVKDYFTTVEAVHFTGFSRYMLDYLAREEIFVPSLSVGDGAGIARRYSYQDVVLLRALNAVCKAKGKIRHLKEALLSFRIAMGPMQPGMRLDQLLFVEGDELCLRTSRESSLVLRNGQMLLASVVDMGVVTSAIAEGVVVEGAGKFRLTDAAQQAVEQIRSRYWEKVRELRNTREDRVLRAPRKAA